MRCALICTFGRRERPAKCTYKTEDTTVKQVYNPYLPSYEYVPDGEPLGEIAVLLDTQEWTSLTGGVRIGAGVHALYFCFEGEGTVDLRSFELTVGSH